MRKIFLLLYTFLLAVATTNAQAVKNSGNFQVHTGGSFSCFLDFTNSSTAALVNNGSLYLRANLTNDQASMSAGTGTLYLNGSSAQAAGGSQTFKTNNLETNNSSGITLNIDLSVAGAHTFSNGLIATSSTPNYLIYESGSSHSGSADSRHVNGWVKKIGSTDFTFPVGDASYLRTIAISSLTLSSEFDCKYFTPTSNIFNLSSPIIKVKGNEYWQLNKNSGGDAAVTLNWDHSKVAMDNVTLTDIRSSLYTGGLWTNTGGSASGNVTTTGTITSGSLSSFGAMTLGYLSYPIPLDLISFTGERRGTDNILHWVSQNEYDLQEYEVQRSFDARQYNLVGKVDGRNSGNREQYSFTDPVTYQGIAYYRLRCVDLDGNFKYSNIIALADHSFAGAGLLVPNPVRRVITIFNRAGSGEDYSYQLFSAAGQLVSKGQIQLPVSGSAVIELPVHIANGIYQLELSGSRNRFIEKLYITR